MDTTGSKKTRNVNTSIDLEDTSPFKHPWMSGIVKFKFNGLMMHKLLGPKKIKILKVYNIIILPH